MTARPPSAASAVIHWSPGANWSPGKTIYEQNLADHVAYLLDLYERGVVIGAGPLTDGSGGMTLVRVGNLAEAGRLVSDDPAVRRGVLAGRVVGWSPIDWEERMMKRRKAGTEPGEGARA